MKEGFNLLKPQVEPPSVWTKIYDWTVNTARVILIISVIAMFIALGARIVIDIQSKQLDSQIQDLQSVMQVRGPEEAKYRTLQSRVQGYITAWTNTPTYASIMDTLDQELPPSATNLQISINGSTISVNGYALSSDLDTMEKDLKVSPLFTKTTLTRLEVTDQSTSANAGYAKFLFDTAIVNLNMRVMPTPTPTPTPIVSPVTDTPNPT